MSSSVEMAQEVLDRILQLLPLHSVPLRQLDPGETGERLFNLGPYYFKVVRAVPRFFSLTWPFGQVITVIVQKHASFNYFVTEGRPFVLEMKNKDDPKWTIMVDECRELLTFLRTEMVLSDLATVRDHMVPAEGDIRS